jgi:hypothetical protein
MEKIASRIFVVRGQRVMLDVDLADIYGVTTKALNQALKRNLERFPEDFAFQLNASEAARSRSQIAISNLQRADSNEDCGNRHPRIYPWVFTDHGALMAANVLRSKQAVQVSVHVVRASVRLREVVAANKRLAKLLDELERRVSHHDETITSIVKAIRELATPPEPKPKRRIGFVSDE